MTDVIVKDYVYSFISQLADVIAIIKLKLKLTLFYYSPILTVVAVVLNNISFKNL